MTARVLAIAGSDSGGGAGIQADIRAITALGGYAATAITALTAQNTLGVQDILPVPPAFVARQIDSVLADIGADAAKTGMLGTAEVIEAVATALAGRGLPLVIDPVMAATTGSRLLAEDALGALTRRLFPLATLVTPNLPEAEALLGGRIATEAEMRAALPALRALGADAVLLKGGHLAGDHLVDLLDDGAEVTAFRAARIPSRHTHGTGCTLASAIATGLAQHLPLPAAVARARAYVRAAIAAAPGLGAGNGPLGVPPDAAFLTPPPRSA
jgi:hydroxymethylpyrimidine/phosphomethylpyrimidine kinase